MTRETNAAASESETEDRDKGTTADINRPIALSGNARAHLENRDGDGEAKCEPEQSGNKVPGN